MTRSVLLFSVLSSLISACGPGEPDFTVRPGVETATVLDGEPGVAYTLYNEADEPLITLVADDFGQAHFAYIPPSHETYTTGPGFTYEGSDFVTLAGGLEYEVRAEIDGKELTSLPFTVLNIDDPGPGTPYTEQTLTGLEWSLIEDKPEDLTPGFQYIEMRDGVTLSAMVRYPDTKIYGTGPWPTVVEYSGYSPSRPDSPDAGTTIANAMGYATVSVNMRGTGCSGGVFDVFNPAQQADGYDIIETVAAQDWVLNNRVGMVGLSYPGISQLYVASTNPPSLAAIVPLSVIADAWEMQWPGGIYNSGFTQNWVEQREKDATIGGSSWVSAMIEAGDTTCEENKKLSTQNIDFEPFLRGQLTRPALSDARDIRQLVGQIEAPVFLGGQWQDEQTGAQFGDMLDKFDSAKDLKVVLSNGRHIDGLAPDTLVKWHEFLEFHLSERVPEIDIAIRLFGGAEIGGPFGLPDYKFPSGRFGDMSFDEALESYLSEPDVTVLFESGAGEADKPGRPLITFQTDYETWPPPTTERRTLYADADGFLGADAPTTAGADLWSFDVDAGQEDFFGPKGYELFEPVWDINWTRFAPGDSVSYLTAPFTTDEVISGPAVASLWVNSEEADVTVQVTLTEITPEGDEFYIQSGWLRLGHRAATVAEDLRITRSFDAADYAEMPPGEWVQADVAIPSFAHPMRAGSQLLMRVSTPGRDHGTWLFDNPEYSGTPAFKLGRGGDHATALHYSILPGLEIPAERPLCPSLRGQPCRPFEDTPNVVAD